MIDGMKTKIKIGGMIYQVEITEVEENLLRVKIENREYFFSEDEFGELKEVKKEDIRSFSSKKENGVFLENLNGREIKAPIAGVISGIYVKEKDNLKPGQKVVTLIAMKMENEIVSERYSKVREIKVKENQFVNKDEVLITLE